MAQLLRPDRRVPLLPGAALPSCGGLPRSYCCSSTGLGAKLQKQVRARVCAPLAYAAVELRARLHAGDGAAACAAGAARRQPPPRRHLHACGQRSCCRANSSSFYRASLDMRLSCLRACCPPIDAVAATVDGELAITSNWDGGFCGSLMTRNPGTQPSTTWAGLFTFSGGKLTTGPNGNGVVSLEGAGCCAAAAHDGAPAAGQAVPLQGQRQSRAVLIAVPFHAIVLPCRPRRSATRSGPLCLTTPPRCAAQQVGCVCA